MSIVNPLKTYHFENLVFIATFSKFKLVGVLDTKYPLVGRRELVIADVQR